MALSSLTSAITILANWNASLTVTGSSPITSSGSKTKSISTGTAAANAAAGGGDEIIAGYVSIAASGNTVLDLEAIVDVSGATVDLVRVKAAIFWLLSATDTAFDGVTVGLATSSITIGGAASNQQKLFLTAAADTFDLLNGEMLCWISPSAAGKAVDATNSDIKILNNDGAVAARVNYLFVGGTS